MPDLETLELGDVSCREPPPNHDQRSRGLHPPYLNIFSLGIHFRMANLSVLPTTIEWLLPLDSPLRGGAVP